jgi:hypothetical protein
MSSPKVVLPTLTSKNWSEWKGDAEAFFGALKMLDVVIKGPRSAGNGVSPEQAAEDSEKDATSRHYMYLALSRDIKLTVQHIKSGHQMWKTLNERFAGQSRARKAELEQLKLMLKKKDDEDMHTYFGRGMSLCADLNDAGVSTTEDDMVQKLLDGLPEHYTVLRELYQQEEALTYDRVLPGLLKLESKLALQKQKSEEDSAMVAQQKKRFQKHKPKPAQQQEQKQQPQRQQNKQNEGNKEKQHAHGNYHQKRHSYQNRSPRICYICDSPDHTYLNCPQRVVPASSSPAARVADDAGPSSTSLHTSYRPAATWEESGLIAGKLHNMHVGWHVDTGATKHMTPFRSDFYEYAPYNGTVQFGNATGNAVGIGTVKLLTKTATGSYTLWLTDVLHVPSLTARLLSSIAVCMLDCETASSQLLCDAKGAKLVLNGEVVFEAPRIQNAYIL